MTRDTKAVIAVHLFGNVAPIAEIEALGVPVIEDAAQALGSTSEGGRPGSLGTLATLSFYPSKNLGAFGDAGAVLTRDAELADRVTMLRFHGSRDKVTYEQVGYNSRLDELQAAILRVQLPHLDAWADHRREAARWYADAGLGEWAELPKPTAGADPAWHLYVIRSEQSEALERALPDAGIGARSYYRVPVHRQPAMAHLARGRAAARHRPRRPRASRHPHQRRHHARAGARGRRRDRPMRIWVDLTNSPHVLVLRPVVERLRAAGHDVRVTARDFAQTVELAEQHGLNAEVIGRHRGEKLGAKAVGLVSRSVALTRWARGKRFDMAFGHGSNDVSVAARLLRIPCSTMFDYEWAKVQHNVNCRLAQAVVVPDVIPVERLERYGARGKVRGYPGLKEEYYLSDFEPDPGVLAQLGLDASKPIAVVRTPPAVSLYHRFENPLFADVLDRLREVQAVVLPRVAQQREELARDFIVPEHAIDAPSLIAFADLVVSAGGTMNREAVALGTPVWTTFEGRLGAVDEHLIAGGRLNRLTDARELPLGKRSAAVGDRVRRDPQVLVDLLLSPLGAKGGVGGRE